MEKILEKIYKSSLYFIDSLTPEQTYALIVKEAVKLVGANYGSLLVSTEEGFVEAYSSLPVKLRRRKKGYTYKAFKDKKAYVIHEETFGKTHPILTKLGLRSNIYIPLSYRNTSIGVLIVNSKKKEYFSTKELKILKLFGSMASLSIRKTQLFAQTKRAVEIRDQFIPLAAHELRTPLTSINGYIQLLHSRLRGKKTVEGKWINELYFESNRLTRLVTELLEINKINSNQLNLVLKECDMKDLLDVAVERFKKIYPSRQVYLQNGLSLKQRKVIADKERIEMIITHLLENAAKFSADDKKINIILLNNQNYIVLLIQDQGEGINKEHLTKIFEGFYKGEFIHKSGMGLGLFLTKAIVEAHKGQMKLQSKLKKGTKVTIKLPMLKQ